MQSADAEESAKQPKLASTPSKLCVLCAENKPHHAFSKKQWAGKAGSRKCATCIAGAQEFDSSRSSLLSSASTPEKQDLGAQQSLAGPGAQQGEDGECKQLAVGVTISTHSLKRSTLNGLRGELLRYAFGFAGPPP